MEHTRFQLFSKRGLSPIAGATVWDYSKGGKPSLIGVTNCEGYYQSTAPNAKLMLRFIAYGHASYDFNRNNVFTGQFIWMDKNHPASFTGFLSGSTTALWRGKDNGRFYQFTAFGLYRFAKDYDTLVRTEFSQFWLPENFSWPPPEPVAHIAPPSNSFPQIKKPLPPLKWSLIRFRSDAYPVGNSWGIRPPEPYMNFRFPSPGKMIALISQTGDEEETEEFELLN